MSVPSIEKLTALHPWTVIGVRAGDLLGCLANASDAVTVARGDRDDAIERAEVAEGIIPRPEALTEWWDAYGVRLMTVGEDGDWLALGHVEPLRMIAAMRKAARVQLRLDDEETFGAAAYRDAPLAVVEHLRAYFTEHDEYGWFAHWGDDAQAHPAAVDVTVWRV